MPDLVKVGRMDWCNAILLLTTHESKQHIIQAATMSRDRMKSTVDMGNPTNDLSFTKPSAIHS